ncbi:MAG: ABC transporter permease [Anaerolineales bacterium]|nr:ABC transporter permease [Anaerolineales bacterium]
MKPLEALSIAWEAILKNKVRSFLTMLGIIIGVSAVIIMVAISAGTEATIQEQITSLGSNLVFVQSSFSRGGPGQQQQGGLVYDDAAARSRRGRRYCGCGGAKLKRECEVRRCDP